MVLAAVGFYIFQGLRGPAQGPVARDILSGEGLQLKDIHYVQDNPDEGLKWILDAEEVRFSEDRRSIKFRHFQLEVQPERRAAFRLKGERGDYSRETGVIQLWGGLEVTTATGYSMHTGHVLIDEKKRHLRSDESVRISGPFFTVSGQGLFVDLEKEKLKILSGVTAIFEKELSEL